MTAAPAQTDPIPAAEYRERRDRLAALVSERGLDAVVISSPSDLLYLVGRWATAPFGPNPFADVVAMALVVFADGAAVFCSGEPHHSLDGAPEPAAGPLEFARFPTFDSLVPLEPRGGLADALVGALRDAKAIAYQGASLPVGVFDELARQDRLSLQDHQGLVAGMRARKSPAELACLRNSIAICDEAHRVASAAIAAGAEAGEVRDEVLQVVQRAAGGVAPCILETSYLKGGVIVDIAPRIAGYWGDSCATYFHEQPTRRQAVAEQAAREALTGATEAARPGIKASDLDRILRTEVAARAGKPFEGGGGHGIGLDYHEAPRLVPDEHTILDAGMVLAMEPSVVDEDVAVRVEHVIAITADGCEVLSGHLAAAGGP